jgi:hypothetical protein
MHAKVMTQPSRRQTPPRDNQQALILSVIGLHQSMSYGPVLIKPKPFPLPDLSSSIQPKSAFIKSNIESPSHPSDTLALSLTVAQGIGVDNGISKGLQRLSSLKLNHSALPSAFSLLHSPHQLARSPLRPLLVQYTTTTLGATNRVVLLDGELVRAVAADVAHRRTLDSRRIACRAAGTVRGAAGGRLVCFAGHLGGLDSAQLSQQRGN